VVSFGWSTLIDGQWLSSKDLLDGLRLRVLQRLPLPAAARGREAGVHCHQAQRCYQQPVPGMALSDGSLLLAMLPLRAHPVRLLPALL